MQETWTDRAIAAVKTEMEKTTVIEHGWKRVYALRRTLAKITTRDLMRPHPLPAYLR